MLFILSPSKAQNFSKEKYCITPSEPHFKETTLKLVEFLKTKNLSEIKQLFDVSNNIAELNYNRYLNFSPEFNLENSKPAIHAFKGDVYSKLDFDHYSKSDYEFMQKHFVIISGLYGALKPYDLIQPYRLEMKINLKFNEFNNLYELWNKKITNYLNSIIKTDKHNFLINIASNEYFKAIKTDELIIPIINIIFKEQRNNKLKVIAFNAKRARSMISNFVIKNKINKITDIQNFSEDNYKFEKTLSDENNLYFIR